MEAKTLPIYNCQGQEVDSAKLDQHVFDGMVNRDVIYQATVAYTAGQRKGLASTKTRGEVSGGGRKPWKQKGTGRARVGSTRSPLWRHGGVIFGPHPRDFSHALPAKIKSAALKSALCQKVNENNLTLLDNLALEKPKTKEAAKILVNLKVNGAKSVLLLLDKCDNALRLALRNIGPLDFSLAKDTHAYEVLAHKKLIVTKKALGILVDRLSPVRNTKALTGESKISNGVKK